MASSTPKKSRPLIITHKRAIVPISSSTRVSKVLNPSARPAGTCIKRSHEEVASKRIKPTDSRARNKSPSEDEEEEDYKPPRFEVSFSMPPQPFLDPPTWEAMLKRSREKAVQSVVDAPDSDAAQGEESAERSRQRVEREMEYGSMAIRGRSSVRGRGKRGRGSGNVYWGGRH